MAMRSPSRKRRSFLDGRVCRMVHSHRSKGIHYNTQARIIGYKSFRPWFRPLQEKALYSPQNDARLCVSYGCPSAISRGERVARSTECTSTSWVSNISQAKATTSFASNSLQEKISML